MLTQRTFQIASGYEDGNDSNTLRRDPLFKLAAERTPLDIDNLLACSATFSRLKDALSSRDIYRMARALVLQFIAGYSCAPSAITPDLDHTDDATYGQQALSFYNAHRPLLLPAFARIRGSLRRLGDRRIAPRKAPRPGAENAMIMKRVLGLLRQYWLQTHILRLEKRLHFYVRGIF